MCWIRPERQTTALRRNARLPHGERLPNARAHEEPHRHHRRRRDRLQHRLSPRASAASATWWCWSRLQLTHGATWHAAGPGRPAAQQRNLTRLMRYSAELYGKLEAETGQATDWQRRRQPAPRLVAGALAANSSARRRWRKGFGFESHLVSPSEAREQFPLIEPAGVVGAALDRQATATSIRPASPRPMPTGARAGGVRIVEGVRVTALELRRTARDARCVTDQGDDRLRDRGQRRRHVGARRSPRWRARACRPARSSTSTSSPRRRRASRAACRRCAIPTATSI